MTALAAAAAERPPRPTRDFLVIHNLFAPAGRDEAFADFIRRAAGSLHEWERVVYLDPARLAASSAPAYAREWSDRAARLREAIGADAADELYLNAYPTEGSRLLRFAYPRATPLGFGDGIGVNYSPSYFSPSAGRRPESTAAVRVRSVWRAVRPAAGEARRRLLRKPGFPSGWSRTAVERENLLLPGLFDEPAPPGARSRPADFVAMFERLGASIRPDEKTDRIAYARREGRRLTLILTVNLSECGRVSTEDEVSAYLRVLDTARPAADDLVVIKPHPRDAAGKISLLRDALRERRTEVVVLDDPESFFVPFEAVYSRFIEQGRGGREVAAICFSSACLSLEYLYGVPCVVGFGDHLVRKHFAEGWKDSRLLHEDDLRRALEAIRAGRFDEAFGAAAVPERGRR